MTSIWLTFEYFIRCIQFSHLNTLNIKHGVVVEETVVLTHVTEKGITDVLTMVTK